MTFRARWAQRRALRAVSGLLRAAADHLDPPRRAPAARHPSVVPDTPPSIASGRADLQLVHGNRRPWHRGQAYASPDRPTGPLPIVTNRCHDTEHQGEA